MNAIKNTHLIKQKTSHARFLPELQMSNCASTSLKTIQETPQEILSHSHFKKERAFIINTRHKIPQRINLLILACIYLYYAILQMEEMTSFVQVGGKAVQLPNYDLLILYDKTQRKIIVLLRISKLQVCTSPIPQRNFFHMLQESPEPCKTPIYLDSKQQANRLDYEMPLTFPPLQCSLLLSRYNIGIQTPSQSLKTDKLPYISVTKRKVTQEEPTEEVPTKNLDI